MLKLAGLAAVLFGLALGTLPAAAADDACDPLAVEVTTTPQLAAGYARVRETKALQASLPDKANAIFFGDSLLAGWKTDLPKTFPETSIFDFAIGGDRVPNLLWRLQNTDLRRLKPSVLVLLIGTNDIGTRTPGCAVVVGINAVIARLEATWPGTPIHVLTIPPRGRDFREFDDQRLEVNRAIAALGTRHPNVHPVVIDDVAFTCGQYGKSISDTQANPACLPAAQLACSNYVDDNLHFSTAGYVELGRILKEASVAALGTSLFN